MADEDHFDPAVAKAREQAIQDELDKIDRATKAADAETALLRHLAREAVLAGERDACAVRHEQLTRALIAARQQREELARAVELAGGKLPQWEV